MKKSHLLLALLVLVMSACTTLGYYSQAIFGHLRLVAARDPIKEVLNRDDLDPELGARLEQVLGIRRFASERLKLPDNDSYRYFTRLKEDYVVWNVVATPRFSLNPIVWCFPVAGCVPYRGYFDYKDAKAFAASQRARGYDVAVAGATAYSTLGWFADPVLSSMLGYPPPALAGFIFHELAHQQVYVKGDAAFNEAFASFVEQKGVTAWLDEYGNQRMRTMRQQRAERAEAFTALLLDAREELQALYKKHQNASAGVLKAAKQSVFDQLKSRYRKLSRGWDKTYDGWMQQDLNNAHLTLVATYHAGVPAFETLFEQVSGDWDAFYQRVAMIAQLNDKKRAAWLEN